MKSDIKKFYKKSALAEYKELLQQLKDSPEKYQQDIDDRLAMSMLDRELLIQNKASDEVIKVLDTRIQYYKNFNIHLEKIEIENEIVMLQRETDQLYIHTPEIAKLIRMAIDKEDKTPENILLIIDTILVDNCKLYSGDGIPSGADIAKKVWGNGEHQKTFGELYMHVKEFIENTKSKVSINS